MTDLPPPRAATPLDHAAGRAVRRAREAAGLSRADLAAACGVTTQQVRKYETGANRISVSRLQGIARTLGVRAESLLDHPEAQGATPPLARNVKAAELMTIGMTLDEAALDHLLGVARLVGAARAG